MVLRNARIKKSQVTGIIFNSHIKGTSAIEAKTVDAGKVEATNRESTNMEATEMKATKVEAPRN